MTPLCLDLDKMRLSVSEPQSWSPVGSSSAEAAAAGHLAPADAVILSGSSSAAGGWAAHGADATSLFCPYCYDFA